MQKLMQLRHPAGKKAVSMDESKYEILKKIILNQLKAGESSHAEMLRAIIQNFKKHKIKFPGSIEWHMEWVKLDLEASEIISRVPKSSPHKYMLNKS